jgi:hypothetical protein
MIIQDKPKSKWDKNIEQYNVYAIYWPNEETHFYCWSRISHMLMAQKISEIDIVDNSIGEDFYFVRGKEDTIIGILHKSIADDDLLDNLIENDESAKAEFIRRLGHEP